MLIVCCIVKGEILSSRHNVDCTLKCIKDRISEAPITGTIDKIRPILFDTGNNRSNLSRNSLFEVGP